MQVGDGDERAGREAGHCAGVQAGGDVDEGDCRHSEQSDQQPAVQEVRELLGQRIAGVVQAQAVGGVAAWHKQARTCEQSYRDGYRQVCVDRQ